MKSKRSSAPAPAPSAEVSSADRDLLTHAYKGGLILAWKQDREHGYRLTVGGRSDEFVEVAHLSSYLAKLRAAAAR
jgi:hypothetical protein